MSVGLLAVGWAGALGGCGGFEYEGFLNVPMAMVVRDGLPLVHLSLGDDGEPYPAAVATLSPKSAFDDKGDGSQVMGDLYLRDGVRADITRFIFRDVGLIDSTVDDLGVDDSVVSVDGFLGADVMSQFAVQLDYPAIQSAAASPEGQGQLTLRDEIPDTSDQIAEDCDVARLVAPGGMDEQRCLSVFPTTRRGGGLMLAGDEEVRFAATRLVVPVCLIPDDFVVAEDVPAVPPDQTTGQAATAALATDLGVSVISRAAFERLRLRFPELSEQPGRTLHLPTGPEPVALTEIPRLAIVSDETSDLGPCGELARRQRLLLANTVGVLDPDDEGERGAAVALVREPIPFAILEDTSALLQGLRLELGSQTAEVDVLLGGSFLQFFAVIFDYPGERVITQCVPSAAGVCQAIPRCIEGSSPPCPQFGAP